MDYKALIKAVGTAICVVIVAGIVATIFVFVIVLLPVPYALVTWAIILVVALIAILTSKYYPYFKERG